MKKSRPVTAENPELARKTVLMPLCSDDFVALDPLAETNGFRVDLAYARADNLLFGEPIYRADARLFLHRDLAAIVLKAARACLDQHRLRYVLYDGLRTTDAQEAMLRTKRVRENPQWLSEKLLSLPGTGGHPRGMAVDIGLETLEGGPVDMGTPFDFLAQHSGPEVNPAHREYKNLSPVVCHNRSILTDTMMEAADAIGTPLFPLPQEWWDFRLPPQTYGRFAPLSDADLPPAMRMVTP